MHLILLKIAPQESVLNPENLLTHIVSAVASHWQVIVGVVAMLLVSLSKPSRKTQRAPQQRPSRPRRPRRNALPRRETAKTANELAREVKGAEGELKVTSALIQKLPYGDYQTVNDILIPNGKGGLTQIDHVVVSSFGIFVVETKNWAGWVFGGRKDKQWKVTYRGGGEIQHHNPISQNLGHIEALSHLLELPQADFCNVVCFVGTAQFKTGPLPEVLQGDPSGHIHSFRDPKFAGEKVREILWKLLLSTQSGNPQAVAAHRMQVQTWR